MQGLVAAAWSAGTTLAKPALRLMLRRRLTRGKEIATRLPEREGIDPTPRPPGNLVWLHAASVGETQSVFPLLQELAATGLPILLTTGTVTSARLLEDRRAQLGLDSILHRFVPLDVPAWVARFLDHWRPAAAIFIESELWPNTIAACQARHIPLMLVNARMSARSFASWRRAPGFARQLVQAFTKIHPQSAADAARLQSLGAQSLDPPGNLKLAAPPLPADPAELARLRALLGARPVWLAASTHPGEEDIAARVHAALAPTHPGLVTIVAPRHPERGPALAQSLQAPRRAAGQGPIPGQLWIADTLGELGLLYRLAPIVFIGRSLAGRGGQNPLEPARLGCALAAGPHMGNFEEPEHRLTQAGALTTTPDTAALTTWVARMLADPAARQAAGTAAQAAAQGEAGLPARPRRHHRRTRRMTPPDFWHRNGWPARLLSPLAALVAQSTARRVARPGWRAPVPVLCCGNAGVGGAGKTTVTLDLAQRLRARGIDVHCISRGYGGRARGPLRVDPANHPADLVGDEPLLLAEIAPTWVGADRAASARAAVAAGARALLMDDGLQNPGLIQDMALLVIDGATGFGNGRVMPAGPLREPAAAAAARCRAAVMIGMDLRAARQALPPGLPILDAWLVPDQALHGRKVLAFAGIARPAKFHATLAQAGAELAGTIDFPDHHRFRLRELKSVLARAAQLDAMPVTTPKDAVRLPPAWRQRIRAVGVRLQWGDEAAIDRLLREAVP